MTVRKFIEDSVPYGNIGIEYHDKEGNILDVVEYTWEEAHTIGTDLDMVDVISIDKKEFNILTIVESIHDVRYS
jgi:hypothetical protein